jgi:hypothetical protein
VAVPIAGIIPMQQRSSPKWSALVLAGFLFQFAIAAEGMLIGQERLPAPLPIPAPNAPAPRYSTFVPADVLLEQADARRPPTVDGWIVSELMIDTSLASSDFGQQAVDNSEFQLRLQQYNSQIRIQRAVIDSMRRRLFVYRYFSQGGALFITNETTWLAQLNALETLKNLQAEKNVLIRQHQRQTTPVVHVMNDRAAPR